MDRTNHQERRKTMNNEIITLEVEELEDHVAPGLLFSD